MATVTGSVPGKIRTFLLDHERLIIVVLAALLIWFGSGKIETIIANHDNAQLAAQKLITDAQVKQNQQLAVQVQQDAASLQALQAKLESQNAQLVQANATLVSVLANRQKVDSTLPPTELAARWHALVPQAQPVTSPVGFTVDAGSAVATVQSLEQVPILTEQLKNETIAKQNGDQVIASQTVSITDLNKQATGLNLQIADQAKQCTDQIKVVKDEARKSKRSWFIIGYIAGFASHVFLASHSL